MTDDTDPDPEALLENAKDQRRTSTEPTTTTDADSESSLAEAISDAFDDLEAGDIPSTIAFRDDRLVALFEGLERTGEISTVVTDAQKNLDRDVDPDAATRSETARLLIRLGLQSLDAELLEAGAAGYNRHLQKQADDF